MHKTLTFDLMHRLMILFSIISFPLLGHASDYSIVIHGIPRSVTIAFPDGFHLASSDKEYHQRKILLESIRQNSGFKSHYNEILLRDWSASSIYPSVVVGSLAATDRFQGKISIKDWQDIQQVGKTTNKKLLDEWRQQGISRIEAGSGDSVKIANDLAWLEEQNEPDSIVLFHQTRVIVNGEESIVNGGRKTMYFGGFVVFVEVSVDASQPDALKLLKELLNKISVKSI